MEGQSRWQIKLLGLVAVLAVAAPSGLIGQNRIIAPDSTASLVIPSTFTPLPLNPNAELQFGNPAAEMYVMALLESKEDLPGWNLTRHSMTTVGQILANLDLPEVVGPVSLTVGGHPAVRYELRGAAQGMRIGYIQTTVESASTFAQIVAWTMGSMWDANQETLRRISASVELPSLRAAVSDDVHDIVAGTWAWENTDEPCAGLTQRFVISDDRKTMKIHHSEPIESANGTTTSVTDYVIEDAEHRVLHTFIPGETRLTDNGEPVKWDLVVVARNRIAWHRADWAEGALTEMLRRCDVG